MTIQKVRAALAGISGVHVTPYTASGAVDRALLTRVIDRIAVAGIHNIVSAGNTGEFYALTPDEVRSFMTARSRPTPGARSSPRASAAR